MEKSTKINDDVLSAVKIVFFEKVENGEIRKIENVEKYINGIYRNKRKMGLRRESFEKGIFVSSDNKADNDDNGFDFADMETEKKIRNKRFLKSCLNAVRSEKLKRFFVLRYVVGLTLGETADKMTMSERSAKNYQKRLNEILYRNGDVINEFEIQNNIDRTGLSSKRNKLAYDWQKMKDREMLPKRIKETAITKTE